MSPQKARTMHVCLGLLFVFASCFVRCSGHFESEAAILQDVGCADSVSQRCAEQTVTRRRHLRRDVAAGDEERRGGWLAKNFVMTDSLPDGEREVRVHYNGVTAKETSVGDNGSGLVLRQFTNGSHFIQTILTKDGNLLDCEYVDQKSAVKSFVRNFRKEIRGSPHINPKRRKQKKNNSERDVSRSRSHSRHFQDEDFPTSDLENDYDESSISVDVSLKSLHGDDDDDKSRSWRRPRGFRARRATHRISHGLWNVTIEDLETGRLPRELADWLDFDKTILQCDEIHERLRREYGMTDDDSSSTNVHSGTTSNMGRSKRVPRNALLIPGTKWCGKGNVGLKHNHLGEFSSTDRCCRKHDNGCPFWIDAVSEKYGMFNWRPNTLMHCRCDERFRTCLKLANTDVANMVGRLFFNIVQTKCFVLKPVKVCTERSWWGKCLKKGYAKQAHMRDNLPF